LLLEKVLSHWQKEHWLNLELVAHITHRRELNQICSRRMFAFCSGVKSYVRVFPFQAPRESPLLIQSSAAFPFPSEA
jgi:hypothetical protein